jgi:hypothetical protein
METRARVGYLAMAAGYLCSAYEELAAAGYDAWSNELRCLLDIVAAEMGWLQEGLDDRIKPGSEGADQPP